MRSPSARPISGDQAPAARTTVSAGNVPRVVSTAVTRSPAVRNADGLGAGHDSRAEGRDPLRQPLDEAIGHEERILPAEEGADDPRAERGLGRPGRGPVQHLDRDAGLGEEPRLLPTVRQPLGREEDGHRPRLAEAEVEAALLGELAIELQALDAEAPEERHRLPHPGRGAGRPEPPEPPRELEARPRLDVEGALGAEHPLDALPPHAGRGEGHHVARDDQPRVAVGAARADLALLEKGDVPPVAREVVGGRNADHAAADHHHRAAAHGRRARTGAPAR